MDCLKKYMLFVFCLVTPFASLNAAKNKSQPDTVNCLQLKGRIVKTNGPVTDLCKVELYLNAKVIDSLFIADSRVFNFKLARNNVYTIRITKKNHMAKLVVVNTEFPEDINDLLEFSFKTDLLSVDAANDLNKHALDFPTAIIHFDTKHEIFVFNETYTKEIKREIYSSGDKNRLLAKAYK